MKIVKTLVLSSALGFAALSAAPAHAYNYRCEMAQSRLASAYAELSRVQAMAQNSVAICGQSTQCYIDISNAVQLNQQAVANARQEVRFACRGGWGR